MEFNVSITLRGPDGPIEATIWRGPVECENLPTLLATMGLPTYISNCKVIGIRIEETNV